MQNSPSQNSDAVWSPTLNLTAPVSSGGAYLSKLGFVEALKPFSDSVSGFRRRVFADTPEDRSAATLLSALQGLMAGSQISSSVPSASLVPL